MPSCGLRDLACPWGRLSFGLKAGRVAGYARGTLAQRALKNIRAALRAAGFRALSRAPVVTAFGRVVCGLSPRSLGPKGAKKHSCNPAGCGIWRALGGDSRLAPRLGKLRTASAVPLAQRGLKNIHATLRAAGFGAPSGATVVWPQDQTSCGLRPQRVSRKRHAPKPIDELDARQATFVGVTIISLVAEDDMINQLDTEERSGAGDAIGQGVVLPTGAGIA